MNLFKISLMCIAFMLFFTYCTNPVQEEYEIYREGPRYLLSLDDKIAYYNMALSSSGDKIAVTGLYQDYFVYEMDLNSPQEAEKITKGYKLPANISSITLLPGGNLYLYKKEENIYLNSFDSSFNENEFNIRGINNLHYRDSCIIYSKRIAGTDSVLINIFNLYTGNEENLLSAYSLIIYDQDFHKKSKILAYSCQKNQPSNNRYLVLHNFSTGRKDTIFTDNHITELRFSHNGEYLAWEGANNNLYILNVETNILTINSHSTGIYDIQWREDDQKILLETSSYRYDVYDINNNTYTSFTPLHEYGSIENFVWTDDNKVRFLSYDYGYILNVIDFFSNEILYSLENSYYFNDLNWIAEDSFLFTEYKNGFHILDISTYSWNTYNNPLNEQSNGMFSGDGNKWMLIGSREKIYLLDIISLIEGNVYYLEKNDQYFYYPNNSWISWMGRDGYFSYKTSNGPLKICRFNDNDIKDVKSVPYNSYSKIKWAPYTKTLGEYGIYKDSSKGFQLYFLNSNLTTAIHLVTDINSNLISWSLDGKSIIFLANDYNLYQLKVIYEP